MRFGRQGRLRRPAVSRLWMVLAPVLTISATMAVLAVLKVSVDTSLGIAGMVFGLATLLMSELRERDGPRKRILYVGQDDVVFNDNILEGLRSVLGPALPFDLTAGSPPQGTVDPVAWQVNTLEGVDVEGADAVVVLPTGDDPRIWRALLRLTASGLTVVVVDFEPPQDLFLDQRLRPPLFVASDFVAGGRLAGELVARQLGTAPSCHALVCIGPEWSRPGAGRSSQILYELARRSLIDRVQAYELPSWDVGRVTAEVLPAIEASLSDPARSLVVFCGDDRIMIALSRAGLKRPDWSGRLSLVGYDGTRAADGRYLAQDHDLSLATIDTQPVMQGKAAGRALVEAYQGQVRGNVGRWLVTPKAIEAPGWT